MSESQEVLQRCFESQGESESAVPMRILDNLPDGLVILDRDWRYTHVNAHAARIYGRPRSELIGNCVWDLFPFIVGTEMERGMRRAADEQIACEFQSSDAAAERIYENRAFPTPDGGLGVHFRDVTDRRRAEERLRRSEEQLAEAQALAHVGSWNWDLATNMVTWSDEHFRIFGLERREGPMTFDPVISVIHPDDFPRVQRMIDEALRDNEPFDCSMRVLRQDGAVRFVQSRGRALYDHDGKPFRMYGTVQDVTDRMWAEQELRRLTGRVVEVQEEERRHLARELHDEIGQTLTAIGINLQAAKRSSSGPAPKILEECIGIVDNAIQQVRHLALDLRPSMLDDLGLVAALRWYIDRQAQRVGYRARFAAEPEEVHVAPAVAIAAFRVAQEALTNIARHAGARQVWMRILVRDGTLHLSIRDDGAGFNPEAALHKGARGTGLGLLGMRERAALLGGRVEIRSAPGRGARVGLTLPAGSQ